MLDESGWLLWSFGAIALFGVVTMLFRRRRAGRWTGHLSILIAIALIVLLAALLLDPGG